MYKDQQFSTRKNMLNWLNSNKYVDVISIMDEGTCYYVVYWEEEPQPTQKDLIPESDKT